MKAELKAIVTEGRSAECCVDRKRLNQFTHRRWLWEIEQIHWERVKELRILGIRRPADHVAAQAYEEWGCGCFIDDTEQWVLVIGADANQLSIVLPRCGPSLKVLDMRFLEYTSLNVAKMPNLELLRVSMMRTPVKIDSLSSLKMLQELDLSFAGLESKFTLPVLKSLRVLDLSGNTKLSSIPGLPQCHRLEELDLSGTAIVNLRLVQLKKLQRLRLMDTRKLEYLEGMNALADLEYLDLSCSGIRTIPDAIQNMKKLKRLDLSYVKVNAFPEWLTAMDLQFTCRGDGINLCGAVFPGDPTKKFQPQAGETTEQFHNRAKQLIEDWNNDVPRPLDEVRVVFLGDGGAGKSYIIARLRNDGDKPLDFTSVETPGVSIHDETYDIQGRSYQVHLWDFGGQKSLYSMHRIFLSSRTLYVVVVDVSENTQQERAEYWLTAIKSFAAGAPVLLVLNQMDKREDAYVVKENLININPNLKKVVELSAKNDSQEKFVTDFLDVMKSLIGNTEELNEAFPPACYKLRTALQEIGRSYISMEEYNAKADLYAVDQETRTSLLKRFNDLGISYYHPGLPRHMDYVVLRPSWIANAISILMFNRLDDAKSGTISPKSIEKILNVDSDIKRILEKEIYQPDDVTFVLNVMRICYLSFPFGQDCEFIPMLCQENRPQTQVHYDTDVDTLTLRLNFTYLPDYLIHRLMTELRGELDPNRVWNDGAFFTNRDNLASAEVFCEKKELMIVVRGKKPIHSGKVYLNTIREVIDRIVIDMNLLEPNVTMLYQADENKWDISYQDLRYDTEDGVETHRISSARRTIPMQDLWDQTCIEVEVMQKILERKLQTFFATSQIGSTKLCTDINGRDLGFVQALQTTLDTPRGMQLHVSADSDEAGAILDIRWDPQLPWTRLLMLHMTSDQDGLQTWNLQVEDTLKRCILAHIPFFVLVSLTDRDLTLFDRIHTECSPHLFSSNPNCSLLRLAAETPVVAENPQLFMSNCFYDCNGIPMKVLHILVHTDEISQET